MGIRLLRMLYLKEKIEEGAISLVCNEPNVLVLDELNKIKLGLPLDLHLLMHVDQGKGVLYDKTGIFSSLFAIYSNKDKKYFYDMEDDKVLIGSKGKTILPVALLLNTFELLESLKLINKKIFDNKVNNFSLNLYQLLFPVVEVVCSQDTFNSYYSIS